MTTGQETDLVEQGMESPGFDPSKTAAIMASSQRRAVSCAAMRRISRCRVHKHLQLTFTKCGGWPRGLLSWEDGKALSVLE